MAGNNRKKPNPGSPNFPSNNLPLAGSVRPAPTWAFSFRYFQQIKYFGLDRSEPKWFISLLERFQSMGGIDVDAFRSNATAKGAARFHEIDWAKKNIPIQREDLKWLPREYRDNEEEFPLLQFQISQALGRVVGFFGEESSIFYVVLLDPLHNIQPTKSYQYKVDDCDPLSCQYTSLLKDIDDVTKVAAKCPHCETSVKLAALPTKNNDTNFIAIFLEDEYRDLLNQVLEGKNISDIIELGLLAYKESEEKGQ